MPVSFIWPAMLLLLLALPAALALYLRLQARRRRLAAAFGQAGLRAGTPGGRADWRQHAPPALFLAALALLVVALARPQAAVGLPRLEGTVVLVMDVSGSMAADDLEPTRLEAAKAAAQEFVRNQPPGVQIGVVAFSDNGFAVQAPTDDQAALLAALDRLTPQRGTSLAQGLLAALSVLAADAEQTAPRLYTNREPAPPVTPTPVPAGTYTSAVIVLMSDGENNENPDPAAAARAAADRGVRVYTAGLGSAEGTMLEVNGFTVFTQLDEARLQEIAQLTDGAYYRAEDAEALRAVYEDIARTWVTRTDEMEVTALLAGAGLLLLLIGAGLSLWWSGHLP